jgi:hypothetical protein
MDVVIREMHYPVGASRVESGFYSFVMFTVYFLWSLCVFQLTAFHRTGH